MRLDGLSAYAPDEVWSNARVAARLRLERMHVRSRASGNGGGALTPEQAKLFETSDRWVRRFIGFSERRFCREGEGTIDLAARAARQLFERSGRTPADVDAIIVGSVTPSYLYSPPDAALLQRSSASRCGRDRSRARSRASMSPWPAAAGWPPSCCATP